MSLIDGVLLSASTTQKGEAVVEAYLATSATWSGLSGRACKVGSKQKGEEQATDQRQGPVSTAAARATLLGIALHLRLIRPTLQILKNVYVLQGNLPGMG